MAVILNVEHLRKHYGPDPVLADVTFQVREGDKIGLVGPNGCGKTTLLNILSGKDESEKGTIERFSGATIGYLEQRPQTDATETVLDAGRAALAHLTDAQREAEEIAEKMADPALGAEEHERLARRYDKLHEYLMRHDAYNIEHRVQRILLGVGFREEDMPKSVSSLSGGELNRLGLAKLLLEEPDIMLLDEPSNHLDLAATEWLIAQGYTNAGKVAIQGGSNGGLLVGARSTTIPAISRNTPFSKRNGSPFRKRPTRSGSKKSRRPKTSFAKITTEKTRPRVRKTDAKSSSGSKRIRRNSRATSPPRP